MVLTSDIESVSDLESENYGIGNFSLSVKPGQPECAISRTASALISGSAKLGCRASLVAEDTPFPARMISATAVTANG